MTGGNGVAVPAGRSVDSTGAISAGSTAAAAVTVNHQWLGASPGTNLPRARIRTGGRPPASAGAEEWKFLAFNNNDGNGGFVGSLIIPDPSGGTPEPCRSNQPKPPQPTTVDYHARPYTVRAESPRASLLSRYPNGPNPAAGVRGVTSLR
jgi:hypothetical protein